MQLLSEHGWRYGGESSGHLLCLDANTTGDGIVAALQVLQALAETATDLHTWQQRMVKMPQVMINVKRSRQADVMSLPEITAAVGGD